MILREYQNQLVDKINAAWGRVRSVLAVSATGTGKTATFVYVVKNHKGSAAVVAHRFEIISQISLALARQKVKHRVVAPADLVTSIRRLHLQETGSQMVDPHSPVGVVSVQTVTSKASGRNHTLQRWLSQVSLAVLDEGHHYVTKGSWGAVLNAFRQAKVLGVTACPERADGLGLGVRADGYAEELVEGVTTEWGIRNGYLSPFVYKCPEADVDFSGLEATASGDFSTRKMRGRIRESKLVGHVVDHYLMHAKGKQTLVFANDVETANDHAAEFRAKGVPAVVVTGDDLTSYRNQTLTGFARREISVVINVNLFDEGLDIPGVECVIMARRTLSLNKFLQMCGRALRPVYAEGMPLTTAEERHAAIAAGPKPAAILLDMVRNWELNGGPPTAPHIWSLDGREKGSRRTRPPSEDSPCVYCSQLFLRVLKVCPVCGEERPGPSRRESPDQVAGDLFELPMDVLEGIYAKIRKARMTDAEFREYMAVRRVPTTYQNAHLKRHRETRSRIEVLDRLLQCWTSGLQSTGMPMDEIHRRFYSRFGVDIGTASALPRKDTDALIERILNAFTEDFRK